MPAGAGLPATPGARIFEVLAGDLRDLDAGRVSGLLAPCEVGHNLPLAEREWTRRLWAAVAVECRRLRLGGRGALTKASEEVGRELGGIDARTLRRWHKDFQPGGNAPVDCKRLFEREFADARKVPDHPLLPGTDEQKRADHARALAILESQALSRAVDWTLFMGVPGQRDK